MVFVAAGGLLALRWTRAGWLHLPALAWGEAIEFMRWICPVTPLENALRRCGGEAGYGGGFIDHYLPPLPYPPGLTRELRWAPGAGFLPFNAAVYLWVWHRRRCGGLAVGMAGPHRCAPTFRP